VTMRRITVIAVAVALVGLASGCVYYNTFYHAREASRDAAVLREDRPPDTDPTARERELYDRVIEKSGRVLALHPDSSWADDALLLLGQALAYQGRYESASVRLNDFLTLYPDSELRPEAEYSLASVLIEQGNPVTAEELLVGVAYADPPTELSDDALLLIGDARAARRRYEDASEAYMAALERFPGSDQRARIRFRAAENFVAVGRYEDAAEHFARVPDETSSRTLAFEARLRLSEVLLEMGRAEAALDVAIDLAGRTTDRDELDRAELQRGLALEGLDRHADAIEMYEEIAASHARSEGASKAYYRIGVIKRDDLDDLDGAVDAFRSAREAFGRGETAELAERAAEDIVRLKEYVRTIQDYERFLEKSAAEGEPQSQAEVGTREAAPDSLPGVDVAPDDAADPDVTDTAARLPGAASPGDTASGSEPDDVPGAPGDTTRGSLFSGALPGMTGGDNATATTVVDTTSLNGLATARADSAAPSPGEEAARARFLLAELHLFRFEDSARALELYREVLDIHPDTEYAPRAALAVAWILETEMGDPDAARSAYQNVLDTYPGTDRAEAAAEGLKRLGPPEGR